MSAVLSPTYREACLWLDQAPAEQLPVTDLPEAADVVVVGAGYCGLSAAAAAAETGADVVVLEAEPLGWRASTRNGGMVLPELKAAPDDLAAKIGPLAYRLYDELEQAFDHIESLARDIDCDYDRSGQLYLAHSPRHTEHVRELARQLPEASYLDAAQVRERIGSDAFYGGAFFARMGGLHPAKFHQGLAKRAIAAGAAVHDRTAVTSVRPAANGHMVETTRGAVRARQVVVATNAYADAAVPQVAAQVLPINSYIIATQPLPADVKDTIGSAMMVDTKNLLNYWRLTPDGRMAFGGRRSLEPAEVSTARDFLYDRMVAVHPQLAGVAIDFAWTGYVAMTRDRLPHVGTVEGAWYATGCNGSGVCLNTWLGHRLGQVVTAAAPPPAFAELKHPSIPAKSLSPMYVPFVGRYFVWQDSR